MFYRNMALPEIIWMCVLLPFMMKYIGEFISDTDNQTSEWELLIGIGWRAVVFAILCNAPFTLWKFLKKAKMRSQS